MTQALDQARQLRALVESRRLGTEAARNRARIVTVTSGKGGVGKTSFSVNFAIALSQMGKRVVLVDADFGLANVDVLLGVNIAYDLSYVIRGEKTLKEIINVGTGGIRFISGGSGVPDLINLGAAKLEEVVEQLCTLDEEADVIVFDTGAGIHDDIMKMIRSSDDTIVVMTPEPTSIVDAFALIKAIKANCGACNLSVIVNRADTVLEAVSTADGFNGVLEKYIGRKANMLGYICYDRSVIRAIKMQQPFVLRFPSCTASDNVRQIAYRFLDVPDTRRGGLRRFLQKIRGKA